MVVTSIRYVRQGYRPDGGHITAKSEMTNKKDAPIKSQVSKGKNRHLKEHAGL